MSRSQLLFTTEEVQALIDANEPNLRLVNATWYIPGNGDAVADHKNERLTETTQHIFLPDVSDPENPLPQMLCSAEQWLEVMRKHHIRRNDNIVCYDASGMFSVARIALMFRYFGARKVHIMDGGLKKWKLEGRPLFSGDYTPGFGLEEEGDYKWNEAKKGKFVHNISTIHEAARSCYFGSNEIQILDARPNVLTYGGNRVGYLGGHIPGSISMFAQDLINQEDGTLKTEEEIAAVSSVVLT